MFGALCLVLYANSGYKPVAPGDQLLLITLPMMILGFLAITLKCERCGTGLFNLRTEKPRDSFKRLFSIRTYVLPKSCPNCGYERY